MSAADWYAHKSLGDGLFWIQERFYQSDNRANIWLLRGSHQDVVIDTGLGLRSLPDYIDAKGLLGKDPQRKNPLLAIATHAHFDHSGGLHQFQQVGVHSAEVDALANGDNFETVTWLSDREITVAPSPGWRARHYKVKAVQPTHILQEGGFIIEKVKPVIGRWDREVLLALHSRNIEVDTIGRFPMGGFGRQ